MIPYANYVREYHAAIQTGTVTVGKWIKLVYDYAVNGLQNGLFYYSAKRQTKR